MLLTRGDIAEGLHRDFFPRRNWQRRVSLKEREKMEEAMRPIWKGAITFGLITIPVRMFSAIEEKSLRFHQLHNEDHGRIRYKRVCAACGKEVAWEEITKGYEYEKDRYVVFSEDELERLPGDAIRAIDVISFVPLEEIDPIYFQRPYYLAPEPTGLKAYRLLTQALSASGRIGVAKVVLREKEYLATLRFTGEILALETMNWPDEIRAPEFEELKKRVDIRPQELEMAKSLIENLSDHFEPDRFADTYRLRLEEAMRAKIEGEEVAVTESKEPTAVMDLMEALRASVEATKARNQQEREKIETKA